MSGLSIKLIVGLGNPGDEYSRTRHNAGFWLVDELARRHGGSLRLDRRHQGELVRTQISGQEVWLLKPMTYMNRSAGPIGSVADFYKIGAAEMLIAHDELDLPSGVARLKQAGGHGGHNGLRDAIARFGDAFWRARIGIGHPGDRPQVVDYVLSRPSAADEREIHEAVLATADVIPMLLEQGAQKAMNALHSRGSDAVVKG